MKLDIACDRCGRTNYWHSLTGCDRRWIKTPDVLVLTGGGYRITAHEPSCVRLRGAKRRSISLRSEVGTLVKACGKCKPNINPTNEGGTP